MFTDDLDPLRGVQEGKVGRRWMAIDDRDLFSQSFENAGHPQFRAQCIAIGANVAGENVAFVCVDMLSQPLPGNAHAMPFLCRKWAINMRQTTRGKPKLESSIDQSWSYRSRAAPIRVASLVGLN